MAKKPKDRDPSKPLNVSISAESALVLERLATAYREDNRGLVSTLITWFDSLHPSLQRVILGYPQDGVEDVVADWLESSANDVRAGKLTKLTQPVRLPEPPEGASAGPVDHDGCNHGGNQDVADARKTKAKNRDKSRS